MTGIHLSASSFSKKTHPLRKHNYNIPISTMPAIIINRSVVFGAGINLAALSPAQLRAIFGGLASGGGGPAAARVVRPNVGRRGRWRPAGHGRNRRRAARNRGRGRGRGRVVRGPPRSLKRVEKALLESGVAEEIEDDEDDEDDEKDPTPDESDHGNSYPDDSREVLANLDAYHENIISWSEILLALCVGLPMWEHLFLDSLKDFLQKCTWRSDQRRRPASPSNTGDFMLINDD
ncbi:hypothetical protein CDV31_006355 [Fusarium ambrosium]|uniref:Uncharacterized protein n=1 Tax=Fusarium ambrosium TaxID=131363 RepID=A0A428UDA2_9HYPO|nr:hypothetical protein CDV31_006355 [Fusarium ambrosium]